jgi:hypothetical protein
VFTATRAEAAISGSLEAAGRVAAEIAERPTVGAALEQILAASELPSRSPVR